MKILKYLAMLIGILFLISVLLKMLQKSVSTTIQFNGIDSRRNIASVGILTNGVQSNLYEIPLSEAGMQTYAANDYSLEAAQLGNLLVFKVMDDKNHVLVKKPVDKNKASSFTIYSE